MTSGERLNEYVSYKFTSFRDLFQTNNNTSFVNMKLCKIFVNGQYHYFKQQGQLSILGDVTKSSVVAVEPLYYITARL